MRLPPSDAAPTPADLTPSELTMALGGAVGLLLLLLLAIFVASRFLYICSPSEILIFSGRRHRLSDGSVVGFKVIHGGRALRIPLLETVSRMDMRLFAVEVSVNNAYSRGGIPLAVHAIANVKIASDPRIVHQAVERFLGTPPNTIATVARQTLEGVLREVLSQLTPEEVNEDRLKFAESLVASAKDDFEKLGLQLDVLKVQHVSDEQRYLANLGRARIAAMIRDAENAESAAEQHVAQEQAKAKQRAETAAQQCEAKILQARNGFRAELAKLEAEAKAIENEAQVAAETARAVAEQELQKLRAELAKLFLHVETVLPAEAAAKAAAARARGEAAPTVENGKAAAEALAFVAGEWSSAGAHGREVYVLQHLDSIVGAAIRRVEQLNVGALEIVDGGDSESVSAVLGAFPRGVAKVLEETGRAVGIDLMGLVCAPASVEPGPDTLRGSAGGEAR
jgi:flotillin